LLVTKDEMSQVMGIAIVSAAGDGSDCTYLAQDPSLGSALVTSTREKTEAAAMADFAAMKGASALTNTLTKGLLPDGTPSISGLGDEAAYSTPFLRVRKGNTMLAVSVNLPSRLMDMLRNGQGPDKYAAVVYDMSKTVATTALTRL
jgi:hypothetical protein